MIPPEGTSAKVVSHFEANLLRILQFFLRRDPAAHALPLIFEEVQQPRCLSREAVDLVQDTLARGCIHLLARTSGWWHARHLRAGRVAEGRLWERSPPQEMRLSFSAHTLRFLIWITAENLLDKKKGRWPAPPVEHLTLGDLLLLYLVYGALRESEAASVMRGRALFATHGLCRLAWPEDFADTAAEVEPALLPWTNGVGACILEALQAELAQRWLRVEKGKCTIADWQRLRAVGQSQERVLGPFFQALEKAGRTDLARFLLTVLAEVLPEGQATAQRWLGGLRNAAPRLADRVETNRAALVLLRQLDRLHRWEQEARGVAFFEENYPASQLWKADWELYQGELLHNRAQVILREVEPLKPKEEQT